MPLKRFLRALVFYVLVVLTCEMCTSKTCSNGCGWKGRAAPANEEEKRKRREKYDLVEMRGEKSASGEAGASIYAVRRCPSCHTVWNRDVNASRNIGFIFLWQRGHGGELPPQYRPLRRRRRQGEESGEPQTGSVSVVRRSVSHKGEASQRLAELH